MTRVGDFLSGILADLLPDGITARRDNWIEVARKDVADADALAEAPDVLKRMLNA